MIRAALLAAKGEAAPPAILQEWFRFRRYGIPPLAGGQRDQPLRWFEHAEFLASVYAAWKAWLSGDKTAGWMNAHREEAEIVDWIMESGLYE